jgi:carbohydrate-selective porin OprB
MADRPDDVLTVGFARSNVSRDDAVLDRTTRRLFGFPNKVRRGSTVFELTHSAALMQYWNLQPDLQYIVYSGDTPVDTDAPGQGDGEALLLDLRTVVSF